MSAVWPAGANPRLPERMLIMNNRKLKLFPAGLLALLFSVSAFAQIDCVGGSAAVPNVLLNPGAANTNLNPYINQRHVFCGELRDNNTATGYHSRPGGHDPILAPAVLAARVTGAVTQSTDYPDVYQGVGIQVRQVDGPWVDKQPDFSTFFPDHCTQAQVVASIGYAYSQNPQGASAPFHGPSAPNAGAQHYCTSNDGSLLQVRGYLNSIGGNWIVNTAYPQM